MTIPMRQKTRRAARKSGHELERALDHAGSGAVVLERDVEKGARALKWKAKSASRKL
jgi:hypothetical protein